MSATVRDIQRLTGLSLATISKYLNGGNVLPENRQAIGNAIEELHYEVNEAARGLKTKRSHIVGVLIHDLNNTFAGTIISRIEDVLRQQGYGMFICDCRDNPSLEKEEIRFLLGKRVDGIISFPTSENWDYLQPARERGIPVVLIDRMFQGQDFDSVIVDNEAAAGEAVDTLLSYGHRRIGIICGDDRFYTARERLMGCIRAMEAAGLRTEDACIERGDLSVRHGYDSVQRLMRMEPRPTALFLSNYEITLGAVIGLNDLNLSFPEDVSVIGFDNIMLAQVVKPRLWMVSQPMDLIAVRAAEIMLERLTGNRDIGGRADVLRTRLLKGDSVRMMDQ